MEAAANWRRSPFYNLLQNGRNELCINDNDERFRMTAKLVGDGHKHFATFIHRFGDAGIIGETDCVYSLWRMRRENGPRNCTPSTPESGPMDRRPAGSSGICKTASNEVLKPLHTRAMTGP